MNNLIVEKRELKEQKAAESRKCTKALLPVKDVLELTAGKWRLHIIMVLTCVGELRFKELQRHLPGISGKVLSKDLKDLEMNKLIKRDVYDTYPITVKYSLTEHGKTLEPVVEALREWGLNHRKEIMK
ncbi:MAG: helix-turn-helix transcriptional regulator [Saprospiraceae bacterium]|nr:helix-turn-helix transcriptional regulator [Saprospiraceae bacterium]